MILNSFRVRFFFHHKTLTIHIDFNFCSYRRFDGFVVVVTWSPRYGIKNATNDSRKKVMLFVDRKSHTAKTDIAVFIFQHKFIEYEVFRNRIRVEFYFEILQNQRFYECECFNF